MNARMRVMIGYDGSRHADAAIDALGTAGIRRDAEILIASVVKQQWGTPAVSEMDMVSLASRRAEAALTRGALYRQKVASEAAALVERVAERIRWRFPSWSVLTEVLHGDPAEELLRRADEWRADLIVVGSKGRSAIGRFFLGSVSQKIAEEAKVSVRVVRNESDQNFDEPPRLVIGARSLFDMDRIIKSVGRRVWPDGTKARVIAVDDGKAPGRVSALYPYAFEIFGQATEPLRDLGLEVSVDVIRGEAETIFLQAADGLETDSIFVVARSGVTNVSRLDDTARALVTNATSTVEIVR